MQRAVAVGVAVSNFLDVAREVVKAFCPQEKTVTAGNLVLAEPEFAWQRVVMRVLRLKRRVPRAPFGVETLGNSDGFEKGRFAGAVLADEEGHARMEFERPQLLDRGDRVGIGIERGHKL